MRWRQRQRRAVEREPLLEELLAAEELEIWILHPVVTHRLVGEIVHVFEDCDACHQPRHIDPPCLPWLAFRARRRQRPSGISPGSSVDQYRDLGMREYLDRLAAEDERGDAVAAVRGARSLPSARMVHKS
jgi:hypothetical protein